MLFVLVFVWAAVKAWAMARPAAAIPPMISALVCMKKEKEKPCNVTRDNVTLIVMGTYGITKVHLPPDGHPIVVVIGKIRVIVVQLLR